MFARLRNKFLLLHMSVTSMVMIAAFAIIYLITYNSIQSDIQKKLNARADLRVVSGPESGPGPVSGLPDNGEQQDGAGFTTRYTSPEDPLSFNIEVDADGHILSIDSFLDMPETAYVEAAGTAWSNRNRNSSVTLDGKHWRYSIAQVKTQVIPADGPAYTFDENKYQIMFLDVTESDKRLVQLLTTLLAVGFAMLVVIFVISVAFANRAIKPIAATWEKQKQFVADASHELKTPISIINANYDALMANQEETVRSQLKWMGYIRIGTDRMTKLINDLLSLARIDDANVEFGRILFDASEAVREVMLSMEAVVKEKDIRLTSSIEPGILIRSDQERIKQVTAILLDNAIKYTDDHGRIELTLKKSRRHMIFSVRNSGKGIAGKHLPKIFDRFYRADPSRTHESGGYGLGLSIAKTILERLDGEIQVQSVENEYAEFTVTVCL